ncbi:MAG: chloramphenicol acetyltransferase [Oscillospiraceae bacterium]|nr:chloramphenicol acetyltransferase [Oscillospiraceae bacterium]
MRPVDLASWPRREIFEFFSGISWPYYSVTFRLDVTALRDYTRERGLSFYHSLIWLCTRAIGRVEAFSYAVKDGQLLRLESRRPSFTHLKKGSETFQIVTLPFEEDLAAFCAAAREKAERQDYFIDFAGEGIDMIFFSCLPWVDVTALTNERDFDADDAIPRIAWGKIVEENGRETLGLSIEVNHRFIDGLHIGLFAKELERQIRELGAGA